MFGGDAQGVIDNRFGSALNVALVLEPLAVANISAETEKKSAASQCGIVTQKPTSNRKRRCASRIWSSSSWTLMDKTNLSADFGAATGAE